MELTEKQSEVMHLIHETYGKLYGVSGAVLGSLKKKGLVYSTERRIRNPGFYGILYTAWLLTDAGRVWVKENPKS